MYVSVSTARQTRAKKINDEDIHICRTTMTRNNDVLTLFEDGRRDKMLSRRPAACEIEEKKTCT